MATTRRDYAGCEAFDVGRRQARTFFYGDSPLYEYSRHHNYMVVGVVCLFGAGAHGSSVQDFFVCETYEQATAEVDRCLKTDYENLSNPSTVDYMLGLACEYEIWHLVDDGELWDEWELKVRAFKELAELKEEEIRKLYSGELGVNVSAFLKHYATCQNVKRDMSEIVRIGRLVTGSLGGGYELHDFVNYDRLHLFGSIWELFVYDGYTFHVWRFPSERDYLDFVESHEEMFAGFGSFVYRYLYNEEGVFGYEDIQSDEGVKTIWESIPGGPLDEDIVF